MLRLYKLEDIQESYRNLLANKPESKEGSGSELETNPALDRWDTELCEVINDIIVIIINKDVPQEPKEKAKKLFYEILDKHNNALILNRTLLNLIDYFVGIDLPKSDYFKTDFLKFYRWIDFTYLKEIIHVLLDRNANPVGYFEENHFPGIAHSAFSKISFYNIGFLAFSSKYPQFSHTKLPFTLNDIHDIIKKMALILNQQSKMNRSSIAAGINRPISHSITGPFKCIVIDAMLNNDITAMEALIGAGAKYPPLILTEFVMQYLQYLPESDKDKLFESKAFELLNSYFPNEVAHEIQATYLHHPDTRVYPPPNLIPEKIPDVVSEVVDKDRAPLLKTLIELGANPFRGIRRLVICTLSGSIISPQPAACLNVLDIYAQRALTKLIDKLVEPEYKFESHLGGLYQGGKEIKHKGRTHRVPHTIYEIIIKAQKGIKKPDQAYKILTQDINKLAREAAPENKPRPASRDPRAQEFYEQLRDFVERGRPLPEILDVVPKGMHAFAMGSRKKSTEEKEKREIDFLFRSDIYDKNVLGLISMFVQGGEKNVPVIKDGEVEDIWEQKEHEAHKEDDDIDSSSSPTVPSSPKEQKNR